MKKKQLCLEGDHFKDVEGFYTEFFRVFGGPGSRNLDAIRDILRGGFGRFDYGEPIIVQWNNAQKSKADLGKNQTLKVYGRLLKSDVPTSADNHRKQTQGLTFYEYMVEMIREQPSIEFIEA